MSDYIEKAEIFSENEIAAVLAGANKQSFNNGDKAEKHRKYR